MDMRLPDACTACGQRRGQVSAAAGVTHGDASRAPGGVVESSAAAFDVHRIRDVAMDAPLQGLLVEPAF
jgi:hypothetical protein